MTLIVAAIMAVTHVFIGWRLQKITNLLWPESVRQKLMLLFLASFYLLPFLAFIYYLSLGDPDLLAWPKVLTYWFWFGLIFSFQMLTWLIVLEAIKLSAQFFTKWQKSRINLLYSQAALMTMAVLFIFTAAKMICDTRVIQTDTIPFESSNIPKNIKGLRLVHISDIQGDEYTGRSEIARYVKKVNALEPDLVIFTGDLISYGTDFIDMAAEELAKVDARYGTYAVIGDHDYWAGVSNIKKALDRYGISLLKDENKIIDFGNGRLLLTGITEVYSKQVNSDTLQKLTSAYSTQAFKIMIAHQATEKVVDAAEKAGYDMLLAGHTHGGQLRVPFLGMTFSAAERETPYVSGLYKTGALFININNGLGFTLAPVRYNAPPAISVIELSGE